MPKVERNPKQIMMNLFGITCDAKDHTSKKKSRKGRENKKSETKQNIFNKQLSLLDIFQQVNTDNEKTKDQKGNAFVKVRTEKSKVVASASKQLSIIDLINSNNSEINSIKVTTENNEKANVKKIVNTVKKAIKAVNHKITSMFLGEVGLKQKCKDNVSAIKLLKEIENEKRNANTFEQEVLAKYVGWGGLAQQVFGDNIKKEWEPLANEVKNILTEKEYESAKASTTSAFYTSPKIINFINNLIDKMGFKGGVILEPACGVGNFFGMLPDKIKNSTRRIGVEIDNISGRIAKLLYPENDILIQGFETTDFEDESMDLIYGNVPFGDVKLHDKRYDKYNFKIHDYYFAKSLDLVREGGLIVFITSHYTMDKKDSTIREYIADRANLIAAVRLPETAFYKNANTNVTADILILQKRDSYKKYTGEEFLKTLKNEDGIEINEYFIKYPENMLGHMAIEKGMRGIELPTLKNDGINLEKAFKEIIKTIPKDIYVPDEDSTRIFKPKDLLSAYDYPKVKNYAFVVIENKLYQRIKNKLIPVTFSDKVQNRIVDMIKIRDAVLSLLNFQLTSTDDIKLKKYQHELNYCYDEFIMKYGSINSRDNKRAFYDDPDYPLISSLEKLDSKGNVIGKADIFTKRTIAPEKKISHAENVKEALMISMNEKGCIDLQRIAELIDKEEEVAKDNLLNEGLVFINPQTEKLETKDEYLSGDVRKKLEIAKNAVREDEDPKYKSNVAALEKAQPEWLDFSQIELKLGSAWIPPKYIKDFIIYLLEIKEEYIEKLKVDFIPYQATWIVNHNSIYISSSKQNVEWGTARIDAIDIIEETLNLKQVNVYDTIYDDKTGKDKRVLNRKDTLFARQKQDAIKNAFKEWIWDEKGRRDDLVSIYNNKFNSIRLRQYDGGNLTFPGLSVNAPKPYKHQVDAIARVLYGGNTLLAHCVGAGKTLEMVVSGMELKRLGLCKKPMYVVPNSLVESGQFAREFIQLYPQAKLLIASGRDFAKDRRRKLISKIATGNWDGIIISHSSFGLIPVSNELKEKFLEEEIFAVRQAIKEVDGENKRAVKQLETTLKNLSEKFKKMLDMPKDDGVTFEQLGVDQIFCDEAHHYKNLYLFTKLSNVGNIPKASANKTEDMYMKIKYIQSLHESNRGVVFATGTPISNTMCELYTMQRYLQPKVLEEMGLQTFDAWASTFGEIITSIEINTTGTGYRTKERFAKFYNVPELMTMFRQVADIVTADMIKLPIPELEGGKPIIEQIKACSETKEFIQSLVDRAEAISKGGVSSKDDNMLLVTNEGRKVALDPRLVGINVDYPESKINKCVQNVYNEWLQGKDKKLTQIIFCDICTPKSKIRTVEELMDTTEFNVYVDIKKKLVKMGIPMNEIAFIHDADTPVKKNNLFAKFRSGDVRIMLSSTSKGGEGCNFQDKLAILHELDCPWKPSEIEQREGRILRQGNTNKTVKIYRYCTQSTFDAYSWQTIETKAKFIGQVMTGRTAVRSIDDIDDKIFSYAEMKAASSGNPLIMKKVQVDSEVQKLEVLRQQHKKQEYYLEYKIDNMDSIIKAIEIEILNLTEDIKLRDKNSSTKFKIVLGNKKFEEDSEKESEDNARVAAGKELSNIIKGLGIEEKIEIGTVAGFKIKVKRIGGLDDEVFKEVLYLCGAFEYEIELGYSDLGNIERIENKLNSFNERLTKIKYEKENYLNDLENLKGQQGKPFEYAQKLKELLYEQAKINNELNLNQNQIVESSDDAAESLKEVAI